MRVPQPMNITRQIMHCPKCRNLVQPNSRCCAPCDQILDAGAARAREPGLLRRIKGILRARASRTR